MRAEIPTVGMTSVPAEVRVVDPAKIMCANAVYSRD